MPYYRVPYRMVLKGFYRVWSETPDEAVEMAKTELECSQDKHDVVDINVRVYDVEEVRP